MVRLNLQIIEVIFAILITCETQEKLLCLFDILTPIQ